MKAEREFVMRKETARVGKRFPDWMMAVRSKPHFDGGWVTYVDDQ
ncbi:hypothetical protein KUIN1_46690 [Pseudomonas sp. KUIN-1]|nr:hypothetical protein KUIN1_46690 [Pseudomonas sp. KUIN-1]